MKSLTQRINDLRAEWLRGGGDIPIDRWALRKLAIAQKENERLRREIAELKEGNP